MQPITVIPTQPRRSFDDGGPRIIENARGTAHPEGFRRRAVTPLLATGRAGDLRRVAR